MAFVINDGCVACGASQYEIDGSACVDCGTCAGQCPTGSIEAE